MSDPNQPQQPQQPQPLPIAEVVIRFNPNDGSVTFSGPPNQLLLYGLLMSGLEMAIQQAINVAPAEGGRVLLPGGRRFGL